MAGNHPVLQQHPGVLFRSAARKLPPQDKLSVLVRCSFTMF
jgi:hypothetical protein